MKINQIIIK